jgi:hypothetical protein
VTVIAAGSSLNLNGGNATVFAWYPGQAGGSALAELLFGEKNISAHLPLTFNRDVNDLPPFEDYSMADRTYRYFTGTPLYPFGYGLSYTRFCVEKAETEGRLWIQTTSDEKNCLQIMKSGENNVTTDYLYAGAGKRAFHARCVMDDVE